MVPFLWPFIKVILVAYIIDLRCNLIHDRISVMKALYKINYDINSLYGMYETTQRTFVFSFFAIYPSTPYKLRSLKYSLYYVTLSTFFWFVFVLLLVLRRRAILRKSVCHGLYNQFRELLKLNDLAFDDLINVNNKVNSPRGWCFCCKNVNINCCWCGCGQKLEFVISFRL